MPTPARSSNGKECRKKGGGGLLKYNPSPFRVFVWCTFIIQVECHYPCFQDANSNKIKQWKGVSAGEGVVTQVLSLSSQPVLGDWKIKVTAGVSPSISLSVHNRLELFVVG